MSNSACSNPRIFLTEKVPDFCCVMSVLMSSSLQVSVIIAPTNISFPVFSEAVYQPAPLSEKTLPDTFVVQITALYKVPVIYSIVAGDEKGKLFTGNNKEKDVFLNPASLNL